MLFLGAVSLIAFGNYQQFVESHKGKTTIEGKVSEKATSSHANEVKNMMYKVQVRFLFHSDIKINT